MIARAGKNVVVLLVAIAGCLAAYTAGLSDAHFSALPDAAMSGTTRFPPVSDERKGRMKGRCTACGSIVAMRTIEWGSPDARTPAEMPAEQARVVPVQTRTQHEITIRMADGSARVISSDGPATWRAGQRLILIAGAQ